MEKIISNESAEDQFNKICDDLGIDVQSFDSDDDTKKKIVSGLCLGRIEYDNEVFKINLLKPISAGGKDVSVITISEPTVDQLRSMAGVKNKNDDFGKAMFVVASVSKLGPPVINKIRSRDALLIVSVMSLFL